MDRLLRMVADYHNFCSDAFAKGNQQDAGELDMSELDLIAAAGVPVIKPEDDNFQETPII